MKCTKCGRRVNATGKVFAKCKDGSRCEFINGLGDWVESKLKRLGFKSCKGCKKRKQWLNKVTLRG
jgi:hypothetical protein